MTGRLGIAFISGVQGDDLDHLRAVATSKHFAVHSGPETMRHGFNVDPSPRDLEETYLPAFRATVTEGQVQTVMCAYNSIDEFPACTNKMLLKEHLRDAWGFKGFVVSDCGAIVDVNQGHKKTPDIMHCGCHGACSRNGPVVQHLDAGLQHARGRGAPGSGQRRPGDAGRRTPLHSALPARHVRSARIQSARQDPFSEPPRSQHRHISRKAAEESIVLLKNNGALPLKGEPGKIAVIGPTADQLASILGNYVGTPSTRYPARRDREAVPSSPILYAQGSTLAEGVGVRFRAPRSG